MMAAFLPHAPRYDGCMEGTSRPGHFEVEVPQELEAGAYANFLTVWHTPYEFTLDFGVLQLPQAQDAEDPESPVTVPARVVSRLKIPPSLVFRILQALNENMTNYEERFGEIPRPEEQEPGP